MWTSPDIACSGESRLPIDETMSTDDAGSLFDYGPGTSTLTYTNRDWPGQNGRCAIAGATPLQGVDEAAAEAACKGVITPSFKRACVLDVMATGSAAFADGYRNTQGPVRARIRVPEEKPKE